VRGATVVDANDAARAAVAIGDRPVVGADLAALVDRPSRDAVVGLLASARRGEEAAVGPVRFGDERSEPFELTARRIPAGDGHTDRRTSDPADDAAHDPADDTTDDVVVALRSLAAERRLEGTLDALGDSTLLLDENGLVQWQSDKLEARLGDEADAGIGINPLERIHPEDLPGVLDAWARGVTSEGEVIRYTARSRSVADDDLWQLIEVIGSSQLNNPDVQAMVVQVRNLDDGEVVPSVAETEGRYESLSDAAPIGILVNDAYGRTIYRNVAARELLEQPELRPEDDWRDYVRPEFADALDATIVSATRNGVDGAITAAFDLPSGRSRWLRVHVTPRIIDEEPTLGLITTVEDVTAEVEARLETERLKHMLDAGSDYIAVFRPGGEVLYVNASTSALLDALRAEGKPGELRDLIDDEPRKAWIAAAMAVLETSDVWQGELPLNAGGGRTIPVSAMGVIRRGHEGNLDWIAMHARDITESKAAEQRQRELATHDHLTGLPNRSLFNDRLDGAVARHARDRRGVAVMFCDLDGFKGINDTRGHAAGDVVLVAIADRLRGITREVDTAARVGGDEFVIVCEGVTDTDELAAMAERVIATVSEPIAFDSGDEVRVGISVGVGVADEHGDVDSDRLLTLADKAKYRAKARGGNTFRIVNATTAATGDD
jgi:diguanylate cyclase (GGDEF)-like protein/PAS domain S-box-containing protein